MSFLGANVVVAHVLPAGAGMAVEKSKPRARLGCLYDGTLKILGKKTRVSVNPPIAGKRRDQSVDQSGLPVGATTGIPHGKTQIFLMIGTNKMCERRFVYNSRHCDAVGSSVDHSVSNNR
jgi:hypothetical protein